ncbi:GntR family transcriptional regulator [Nesterenkonia marinintestina]|uniref:GntR family transcriptional regulator n=1 Tax=Nesterenkonia marinintestina TaxID=2979865 RepID=UPI0028FC1AF9|nr:GntR family transcriptional regulator [Nesterenkonia sp. GX14115]
MMTMSVEPSVGAESMADRAYHALRRRLVFLDLTPGAPIAESALSAELGVGRTPLREALKRLEADHLVVTFARRGTFASSVDVAELSGISEMRQALVPLAARKAARQRGGGVAEELARETGRLEAGRGTGGARELLEGDLRIHRLLSSASENLYLEETLVRLDSLVTRMWCAMLDRIPPMQEHVLEHVALIRAVLDGEEARAERLAGAHVDHFDRVVREVV